MCQTSTIFVHKIDQDSKSVVLFADYSPCVKQAQYLFISYIHCISGTCFDVTFIVIRENYCAVYLKPDIVMKYVDIKR